MKVSLLLLLFSLTFSMQVFAADSSCDEAALKAVYDNAKTQCKTMKGAEKKQCRKGAEKPAKKSWKACKKTNKKKGKGDKKKGSEAVCNKIGKFMKLTNKHLDKYDEALNKEVHTLRSDINNYFNANTLCSKEQYKAFKKTYKSLKRKIKKFAKGGTSNKKKAKKYCDKLGKIMKKSNKYLTKHDDKAFNKKVNDMRSAINDLFNEGENCTKADVSKFKAEFKAVKKASKALKKGPGAVSAKYCKKVKKFADKIKNSKAKAFLNEMIDSKNCSKPDARTAKLLYKQEKKLKGCEIEGQVFFKQKRILKCRNEVQDKIMSKVNRAGKRDIKKCQRLAKKLQGKAKGSDKVPTRLINKLVKNGCIAAH
jgi:hypothetical protein